MRLKAHLSATTGKYPSKNKNYRGIFDISILQSHDGKYVVYFEIYKSSQEFDVDVAYSVFITFLLAVNI